MINVETGLGGYGDNNSLRARLIKEELMGQSGVPFTPLSEVNEIVARKIEELDKRPLREKIWNGTKDFLRATKIIPIGGSFGLAYLGVAVLLDNQINLNIILAATAFAVAGGWYFHNSDNRSDQNLDLS